MAAMIELEAVDAITVVRIKRPPANALDPALLAEAAEVIERLRAERPAAVVLAGSGGFFSAGVDLKLAPTLSAADQRRWSARSTASSSTGTDSPTPWSRRSTAMRSPAD